MKVFSQKICPGNVLQKSAKIPFCRLPGRMRNHHAFSMVEVALALGIVGLAMVGILGLLATGLNTARDATDDNMAAQLVQAVVADRKSTSYTLATPSLSATSFAIPALDVFPAGGYALFFQKAGGVPVTDTVGTQKNGYYYEIDMKINAASPTDLAIFDIRASWPANIPLGKRTTYFYTTTFSKYE